MGIARLVNFVFIYLRLSIIGEFSLSSPSPFALPLIAVQFVVVVVVGGGSSLRANVYDETITTNLICL